MDRTPHRECITAGELETKLDAGEGPELLDVLAPQRRGWLRCKDLVAGRAYASARSGVRARSIGDMARQSAP